MYALPHFLVGVLISIEGIFVFTQSKKSILHTAYLITTVTAGIWLTGVGLICFSANEQTAFVWSRYYSWFGIIFVTPAVYLFSATWDDPSLRKKTKIIYFSYFTALVFYMICISSTYLIQGVWHYPKGFFPKAGILEGPFIVWFYTLMALSFGNFVQSYRKEKILIRKKNTKLMIVAFAIAFFGSVEYLSNYGIHVFPVAPLPVFLFISIMGYCVIRYKLMDIETVIHKTLMWAALSSLVFLPLGLTIYYFKNLFQYIHPILSSVFGVGLFCLFMIYTKTIQPWIDHIFQRRKYDLEQTFIKFNDNLVHLKDLDELSSYIVQTIREILYVDQVQIFLKHGGNTSLIRIDAETDGSAEPSYNNTFIRWLEEQDEVALVDFVDIDPRFERVKDQAKRFFEGLGVRVAVPLVLNRELIGLINLGQKANLKPFRSAEVMFLSEFRRAATIALSNSLRLIEMHENLQKWNEELEEKVRQRTQELEDAQKQLIQAEKLATLGTLAGGVAHEINNPLTAILTNIQLLKLDVKDERETESIDLIEEGAKRCREIIQKIMKYARKSDADVMTEKVDLNRVVENTISFLEYQLKQENVEVSMENSGDAPYVSANNSELAQVLTNLILNAKDAVENTGRMGKIQIETFASNGAVGFKVKDNGHGIPKENMNRIFDPFFTTKDVGKGTGLGLAVTYGIVKKYNGDIGVESKLGAGTTFTVTFPKPN